MTNPAFGPLFETFVVNELARQRTWAADVVDLHHLRILTAIPVAATWSAA